MPPLLPPDGAEEAREVEELALAAEKPPERELAFPPELPVALPKAEALLEREAAGGAIEREAVEKLRAGAAVGRAPGFVARIAVDVGAAPRAAPALRRMRQHGRSSQTGRWN